MMHCPFVLVVYLSILPTVELLLALAALFQDVYAWSRFGLLHDYL
jgi:hypothetical protein